MDIVQVMHKSTANANILIVCGEEKEKESGEYLETLSA